jgi:hypothetical protein
VLLLYRNIGFCTTKFVVYVSRILTTNDLLVRHVSTYIGRFQVTVKGNAVTYMKIVGDVCVCVCVCVCVFTELCHLLGGCFYGIVFVFRLVWVQTKTPTQQTTQFSIHTTVVM